MNATQAKFYLDVIRVYREKEVPVEMLDKMFDIIFIELSLVDADELSLEHAKLMEETEIHYAGKEQFKKADVLKKSREAAFKVFEARDLYLKKLKDIQKKNKQDDTETD